MNLSLKPEFESLIRQQITTGKYANPDEVIEAPLNLLEKQNSYKIWQQEVGDKIDLAVAQIERGEGLSGDDVFTSLKAKLQSVKEER
jgi:antitoxin ParD1/3/4